LSSIAGIDQPRRKSERHVIDVANPIAAGISIRLKKLNQIEIRHRRIEEHRRQIVLVAIRHICV